MSITIKLPDDSTRQYDEPITPARVAEDISPRLAAAAIAAEIDGELRDLNTTIDDGTHSVRILTDKNPEALEILRHTTAHIMAQAMINLYGPSVQYTIGPALMDDFQYGFYYDFEMPEPVGIEQLPQIEAEMQRIIDQKLPIAREEMSVDQAKEKFNQLGQRYKVEMIDDLVASEGVDTVSLYTQDSFVDLCRGPHLPDTSKVPVFKLVAAAGAYWRGDQTRPMLTRVYGIAFFKKKQLAEHLERVEQARKRDNRVLGKQLGLFLISDKVGPGLPIWMPNGSIIRMELETWLRQELINMGFQIVYSPHIGKLDLYRTSGHYPYYKESQFPPIMMDEEEGYLLKPMNCPHHIQIYNVAQRSYRELPMRLAEFGAVYRMEKTGELNGLIRVRGFTQDDAHIFCTPQQLESEIESCVEVTKLVLETLGLNEYRVRIGLRDEDSEKYVGDDAHWELAQNNIRSVVQRLEMNYTEEVGEAAFYGPKIDFIATDCIGRQWQLGTIQVDYNLPERFDMEYVGPDNTMHRPVMIHRAPFGSLERFIGILIEHYAGAFPLWLAPVQVAVLPVSEKFADYGQKVNAQLRKAGLRVQLDDSADKIGAKIRRAQMQKIPYMAVVGGREQEAQTVSIRHRSEGDCGPVALEQLLAGLKDEVQTKALLPTAIGKKAD